MLALISTGWIHNRLEIQQAGKTMIIKMAKHCGFCKGVQKAVDTALSIEGDNVFVLGELVHNPQVVNELEEKGIKTVEELSGVPDGATVIFRSHGVPKSYYDECRRRRIRYVDCTCPFVRKIQHIVEDVSSKGRHVIIAGTADHPEVKGLLGWCSGEATVIKDVSELIYMDSDARAELLSHDLSVVSQSTFSSEKFDKIIKFIRKLCEKTVAVFTTICYTTYIRQKEVEAISQTCDAVIVIGGKNSSNTGKLYDIASKYCKNVFWISNPDELDYNNLINFHCVGIVSGASTPAGQAQEVLFNMAEETEVTAAETVEQEVPAVEEATAATETVESAATEAAESVATGTAADEAVSEAAPAAEEKVPTMEDVVNRLDTRRPRFRKGQVISATISAADADGLKVMTGFKYEVPVSKDELDCEVYNPEDYADKIGNQIDLMVIGMDPTNMPKSLVLSEKRVRIQKEEDALIEEIKSGKEFSAEITGTNSGGLTGQIGSYQLFVPAREIRLGFVKELDKYVGKTLRLRYLESNPKRKEIIASQRVILKEEADAREAAKLAKEEEFFNEIEEDEIVEGKVERATNFGAFVSVRGFDCLAHISDLSWAPVAKVTDVLEIGKSYMFVVLKVDKDKKKVSLGYKQLQPKPWETVPEKYAVGDVVTGKVLRITDFGAFVQIEKGVDALLHISQISNERVEDINTVLKKDQEIECKILSIDVENQKMSISMKALLPAPAKTNEGGERKKRFREAREEDENKGSRKPRAPKRDSDELSAWNEGSASGTSIADLINAQKDQK